MIPQPSAGRLAVGSSSTAKQQRAERYAFFKRKSSKTAGMQCRESMRALGYAVSLLPGSVCPSDRHHPVDLSVNSNCNSVLPSCTGNKPTTHGRLFLRVNSITFKHPEQHSCHVTSRRTRALYKVVQI